MLDAIVILTNGDHDSCTRLLDSLPSVGLARQTVVVDDAGRRCVFDRDGVVYFGMVEWEEFARVHDARLPKLHPPATLGLEEWNTAGARNVAQAVCQVLGYVRCLFIDDDHIVDDGARLRGEVERAATREHPTILTSGGVSDLSSMERIEALVRQRGGGTSATREHDGVGGCYVTTRLGQLQYFPRFYNEDLAWLRENRQAEAVRGGMVHCRSPIGFDSLAFQELGKLCFRLYCLPPGTEGAMSESVRLFIRRASRRLGDTLGGLERVGEWRVVAVVNRASRTLRDCSVRRIVECVQRERENRSIWRRHFGLAR